VHVTAMLANEQDALLQDRTRCFVSLDDRAAEREGAERDSSLYRCLRAHGDPGSEVECCSYVNDDGHEVMAALLTGATGVYRGRAAYFSGRTPTRFSADASSALCETGSKERGSRA
jgi:hypothetical protein